VIAGSAQIGALPNTEINGATTIAVGEGAVWAAKAQTGDVWQIEPESTTALRQVTVGPSLAHIAAGDGAVWVARPGAGLVARIDPSSGAVTTIPVGHGAYAVVVGGGLVWVTTLEPGTARDTGPG
jgi:streptogramin lyase